MSEKKPNRETSFANLQAVELWNHSSTFDKISHKSRCKASKISYFPLLTIVQLGIKIVFKFHNLLRTIIFSNTGVKKYHVF